MYTIKHAAEMLGVPAATLRAWQRRYQVVTPKRSDSGYRLYDQDDLATLRRMHWLIEQGWSPKQAATAARAAPSGVGSAAATRAPVPAGMSAEDDLVDAAMALDAGEATRALDDRLAGATFERVADEWLMPQLRRLGDAWQNGMVSVAGEHLVAGAVQRRLSALYDLAGAPGQTAEVVTGLPPGCRHELGILCFAIALRRQGLVVTHLGLDLPAADWLVAVERHRARAAALAVPPATDVEAAASVLQLLLDRGVLVGVGGSEQEALRAACPDRERVAWLGHRIGPAAVAFAEQVAAAPDTARGM